MAYNLEPLVQILEQILHPEYHQRWIVDTGKRPEIESLYKKVCFLKELFENPSPLPSDGIELVESQIRDAAHEAENILESHMADQILSVREGQSFTISPPSLQNLIKELDSVSKAIETIRDKGINSVSYSSSSSAVVDLSRSTQDPNPNKIVVGRSEDLHRLKDRLIAGQPLKVETIPIVGMGGIGKTTLARKVYDDPSVASYFDTRAWITVSQEYDARAILQDLLRCVKLTEEKNDQLALPMPKNLYGTGKLISEILHEDTDKLALRLHKSLFGKRYLIVLDDMWDIKAWDDTRMFFPEQNNGSRILITTRESEVANSAAGSRTSHHQMKLLNVAESWNLLREKVFGQENCPPEFENIGKKIANNCRGLPLAIYVIGGLLVQSKRNPETWKQVANDVGSVAANKDEQFSRIFSLSFNYLPNHLKPCFLYMGIFPEDYEFRASKLIRLWVAEGFLKPIADLSLEEAAKHYLKALVDRNLIFVVQQETSTGNIKSYRIHDLLRDLCVRKAREDKFLYKPNWHVHEDALSLRRVSVHSTYNLQDLLASMKLMSLARSFLCISHSSRVDVCFGLTLLRVLDVLEVEYRQFPEEILGLVNLRYLALACYSDLPFSISSLWNLQTLILGPDRAPTLETSYELLLGISRLRHIEFKRHCTFYDVPKRGSLLFENLLTFSTITVNRGFRHIIQSMPNLKKLGIYGPYEVSYDIDLTLLSKLETLKCSSNMSPKLRPFLSFVILPPSLKRLTLSNCVIPSGCLNKIGTLPHLEVLKLRNSTLESPTWELATEEEEEEEEIMYEVAFNFNKLQFLLLEKLNLVNWVADENPFPRLERLIIRDCSQLEEIPSAFGDIPNLELIELHNSSISATDSARKILEEQIDVGNNDLQVRISSS